jgi:hypothetical protein
MNVTNLTFSLWFKRSGSETGQEIFVTPRSPPAMFGISGNNILVWPDASDNAALAFAYTLNVGQWYHITFQPRYYYNSSGDAVSNTSVFINGVFVSSLYGPAHAQHVNTGLTYIGAYDVGSRAFNGSIDDVRIYNRSLTPTEIQTLYTSSVYSPKALDTWQHAEERGLYAKGFYGEMWDATTRTLVATTQNVWYNLTAWNNTGAELSGWSAGTGSLNYTLVNVEPGLYSVTYTISATLDQNQDTQFGVFINGDLESKSTSFKRFTSGQADVMTNTFLKRFNTGDRIWLTSRVTSASDRTFTNYNKNIVVTRIGS